ncbi:unnamed protein product [Blepharisma stoltei]|uniref:Cytochrome b5 heme-binding domain-containing protein n=1 Tax=Blepharisma stoltei TaxID=1481888 RepID=A0AAU9J478_9CILI|nr:unnamed protein product [Blepharisma stoltei]
MFWLIIGLLFLGAFIYYFSIPSAKPHSPSSTKEFTLEELSVYNGKNAKAYVAVKNKVFDVSSSEAYLPGGSYAQFAGKDATLALSKMNMDPSLLNIRQPINEEEQKVLDDWEKYFEERKGYPLVGTLKLD